jgi:hypothetical protein
MSDDSGHTATDIITYIGVPLAVLGVLPILYNTAVTLINVSKIKRMLVNSRLTALTRSDVVNRVIEIDLPRYAVTPWDRFQHRNYYWQLSSTPSLIPGGSWTQLNWRTNTIGMKTQRVEYADQLRQPQVEVQFDELVCYLMDLGAVPDAHGFRLLRTTGLWTPVGCSLMRSPDGHESALTIAPLDDSDGNLSLSLTWASPWTTRDHSHLPPYWVKLPAPPAPSPPIPESQATAESQSLVDAAADEASLTEARTSKPDREEASSTHKASLDSREAVAGPQVPRDITCQISGDGLLAALTQEDTPPQASSLQLDSLPVTHLRGGDGVWFASAATAFGTTSQTVLWSYRIPDAILAFARRETVPCGVLVMLDVVADSATPEWATAYGGDHGAALDLFAQRQREQRAAIQAEARLAPAQREAAAKDRMRRENEQRLQDSKSLLEWQQCRHGASRS